METKIRIQSFSIGDIFATGWQLYRQKFMQILPIILCVYIPVNIILAFVPVDSLIENYGLRGLRLYQNIIQLLEFFIGTIATIAIAYMVEMAIRGQETSWGESLRHGVSRWASAIGTGFLAGLIILGLTLLLIIPGIIWAGYYSFWVYVVGLRNIGGKAALDYSKNLVKGQWWKVFGVLFVIGIVGFIVAVALSLIFSLISDDQFLQIVPDTLTDLVGALFTIMTVVFFLNTDYLRNPMTVESDTEVNQVE